MSLNPPAIVNMVYSGYLPQWSASFAVPHASAIGRHFIRAQQAEQDTVDLVTIITACKNIPFEVRSSTGDPWTGSDDTTDTSARADTTNRVGITVHFDPSLACDIKACEAIRLIQVMQDIGLQGDTAVVLLPGTGRYFDGESKDSTRTASGFVVDAWGYLGPGLTVEGKPSKAERDPYVNGDDEPWDLKGTTVGFVRGDTTNISLFKDIPGSRDFFYPAAVTRITRRFELCAVCSAGEQRGQYLGALTWRWSRQKGGSAVVDSVQTSRNHPRPMFLDALNLWASKRRFTTPRAQPPVVGGITCP